MEKDIYRAKYRFFLDKSCEATARPPVNVNIIIRRLDAYLASERRPLWMVSVCIDIIFSPEIIKLKH